ncbi:hypothetical protein L1887_10297 [Cichorium endivia]|nr:hypothetical protein L1887_10297 [Cichorium endivia]
MSLSRQYALCFKGFNHSHSDSLSDAIFNMSLGNMIELLFSDVLEGSPCCTDSKEPIVILLKLKHAPKLYHRLSGSKVSPTFTSDRNHIRKDAFQFT